MATLFMWLSAVAIYAQDDSKTTGDISGLVKSAEQPVAGSLVVVHNGDDNTNHSAVTGPDGSFAIPRLKPGQYHVTATKAGYASSSEVVIKLAAGEHYHADIVLGSENQGGFFTRLRRFYQQDWNGTLPSGPTPAKRGLPSPLESPPFPNSDWSYGGSPDIGAPDGNVYPLMTALFGNDLSDYRTKVYGWIEPGLNFSTSKQNNFPSSYSIYPNGLQLDQAVVYIERLPDTVQHDHFDWGYHITGFFGSDYRFTTAKGYFSQQLLVDNNGHGRQYGFDPVMEYVDLYWGQVADGLNIRIGRFISVPGIEAQLAPQNYMFSHSLLYTIDPFTDTGILATLKFNNNWLAQLGVGAGHDVAPWTPDATPSLIACLNYTTTSGNDNFYDCANGINNGHYRYNNLQDFDGTWYHKFNKSWHMATEAWYMYEKDVPNVAGNVANPITPEIGANGAFCNAGQLTCFAPEWAFVNYLQKELNPKNFLSLRTDYLDDIKGQRTGYKTRYSEETLMWGHWIGSTVEIRPEIRYDHAWDLRAYDNGTKTNQLTFEMDTIFRF